MTIFVNRAAIRRRRRRRKLTLFLLAIQFHNSQRFRSKLKRPALLRIEKSCWRKLLHSNDDDSFLNILGFNYRAFFQLVEVLKQDYPFNFEKGRKKRYDFVDCVGLYLIYICSSYRVKDLALVFGLVPSTVSAILSAMIAWVPDKLRSNELARIRWPDENEKRKLARLVHRRQRYCRDVIGFLDGLALRVQCSSDPVVQNMYYNGYQGDTTVNNVILFGADGKIKMASINRPGSFHDSQVATPIAAKAVNELGPYYNK